jgi:cbb3-type cytochrome oxidase maturation protein
LSSTPFGCKNTFDQNHSLSVIIILIIVSLLVASGFLLAFIWSVSHGQYDDDTSPAIRMLYDDHANTTTTSNNQNP